MKHTEYLKYFNPEEYLFNDVSKRFHEDGYLTAFDFFCIVIWKANRAKSKIADRLLAPKHGHKDLDSAVKALTSAIHSEKEPKGRLLIMMNKEKWETRLPKWEFRLPMASAVLTVLYPDEFTIYDVRVCETLNDFKNLQNKSRFEDIWSGYEDFVKRVKSAASEQPTLRNKDRWLWGKSFAEQLEKDIEKQFFTPG
jgi:hypothetical protein